MEKGKLFMCCQVEMVLKVGIMMMGVWAKVGKTRQCQCKEAHCRDFKEGIVGWWDATWGMAEGDCKRGWRRRCE